MENCHVIPFEAGDRQFDAIAELYSSVFPKGNKKEAEDRMKKHAGYHGFKGLAAISEDNVLGFSYGYTSLSDQFYNKKLRDALTPEQAGQWLSDCFEFVELAVHTNVRRSGVATLLHNRLLENLPHKTAVLTTQADNIPARTLYEGKGWQVIREPFYPFGEPYVMMGKKLSEHD